MIQSGKAGRELIDEVSRLMHEAEHILKMGRKFRKIVQSTNRPLVLL